MRRMECRKQGRYYGEVNGMRFERGRRSPSQWERLQVTVEIAAACSGANAFRGRC